MQYAHVCTSRGHGRKEKGFPEWFCCSDGQVSVGAISEEKDEPPTIEETDASARLGQLKDRENPPQAQDMVLACPCTFHREKY